MPSNDDDIQQWMQQQQAAQQQAQIAQRQPVQQPVRQAQSAASSASAPVAPPAQNVGQRADQIVSSMPTVNQHLMDSLSSMGNQAVSAVQNNPLTSLGIAAGLAALYHHVTSGGNQGYGQPNIPSNMPLYPEQATQQQTVPAAEPTLEQNLVNQHTQGVQQEIGQQSVPSTSPKVKANDIESMVRSDVNKHANEQEALEKAKHHTHANPFENVEHELTGTGFPAYRGTGKGEVRKKEMKSLAELGSDLMFVPGGQSMDIVRNAVGQEEYTKNLKKFGGYPVNPKEAYSQSREINKSLGREARETAKAAGTDLGEVTPAITKKVGGSKLVKIGGVAGALISAADLASAKNIPEAALRATDIATDYIPGVGQFKQGMAPKEAGAPVVPPQMFANAAKLGSPYYNTEWAKNERKKAK